jgi:hypothetical protein
MYKKLIESIFESTKITINQNGEYDVECTSSIQLRQYLTRPVGDTKIMNTSLHAFILRNNNLIINDYEKPMIGKNVCIIQGDIFSIKNNKELPLTLTEEQFFQQSTLHDFDDLELEDMQMIKEFYDVVSYFMKNKL